MFVGCVAVSDECKGSRNLSRGSGLSVCSSSERMDPFVIFDYLMTGNLLMVTCWLLREVGSCLHLFGEICFAVEWVGIGCQLYDGVLDSCCD